MNNTIRDRTKEGLDSDNPGLEVVSPPETPVPDASGHVPGGANGGRRTAAALCPPMGGAGHSDKTP